MSSILTYGTIHFRADRAEMNAKARLASALRRAAAGETTDLINANDKRP